MSDVQFVKSFSRGQITIPKDIRDSLGMSEDFWLKLIISDGKIIAEPITDGQKVDKDTWRKNLLQMSQIDINLNEVKEIREQVEKRLKSNAL